MDDGWASVWWWLRYDLMFVVRSRMGGAVYEMYVSVVVESLSSEGASIWSGVSLGVLLLPRERGSLGGRKGCGSTCKGQVYEGV